MYMVTLFFFLNKQTGSSFHPHDAPASVGTEENQPVAAGLWRSGPARGSAGGTVLARTALSLLLPLSN